MKVKAREWAGKEKTTIERPQKSGEHQHGSLTQKSQDAQRSAGGRREDPGKRC